jgi:Domain of unknown function (DUF4082)
MTVYTVFGQPAGGMPSGVASDNLDYTMAMQFTLSQAAPLTGIWFFSAPSAGGLPGACCIYQVTGTGTGSQVSGTVNTSPSWSGAAASGWVRCAYPGTTTLNTATNYKVAVCWGFGLNVYSVTANYWSSGAGSGGITNGPLTGVNNAAGDGGQDTFVSGGGGVLSYPGTSFNASNYWVDVEVTTAAPPAPPQTPVYSMRMMP